MPIYEYRCRRCGELFERLVMNACGCSDPYCPKCGSKEVERALSGFSSAGGSKQDSLTSCNPKKRFA